MERAQPLLSEKKSKKYSTPKKVLAKKYNIDPNTVLKWKHRVSVDDKKPGPYSAFKGPCSPTGSYRHHPYENTPNSP